MVQGGGELEGWGHGWESILGRCRGFGFGLRLGDGGATEEEDQTETGDKARKQAVNQDPKPEVAPYRPEQGGNECPG